MKPTFKQQYDKIVGAYLRNELMPFYDCACFVGNLLNNNGDWFDARKTTDGTTFGSPIVCIIPDQYAINNRGALETIQKEGHGLYSIADICSIEQNFLRTYNKNKGEDGLFSAMESTLLILRQIHESKGEVVEDYIFEKRTLIEA